MVNSFSSSDVIQYDTLPRDSRLTYKNIQIGISQEYKEFSIREKREDSRRVNKAKDEKKEKERNRQKKKWSK